MATGGDQLYRLSHLPEALRQMQALADKAKKLGLAGIYADALENIVIKLQTDPTGWGDPEYHPKKKGSCVYHVLCDPMYVQYVVFEPERAVMVMNVKALPTSPFA